MMLPKLIRLATRGSALALWQARRVSEKILQAAPGVQVELVVITTKPDRLPETSLDSMGGDKGLFVKELELALLDGRADAAVHSLKDVPVEDSTPGLELVAFPERADPSDVLLVREPRETAAGESVLSTLPPGATVATSALRRQAQLLRRRPDLQITSVRGNVDTRIRKLQRGDFDALVMAAAGLERLGLQDHVTGRLSLDEFLPAPGQGILVVQARQESPYDELWRVLDDPLVRLQAECERSFSRLIGATCQSAAGCLLQVETGTVRFRGTVLSSDGKRALITERSGLKRDADQLVRECAQDLSDQGCQTLMSQR